MIKGGLDDAALVRRIREAAPGVDGDAEAVLCRRLAPRVRLYGLRHLRDGPSADDLVQQVMMITVQGLRAGKLREVEKLASFVFGTCRQVVLDSRRRDARRERLLDEFGCGLAPAGEPAVSHVDRDRLLQCLERLSERERSVLVCTFFEDQRAEAVASALALSPGNVRVIRHRGLERLRACMGVA